MVPNVHNGSVELYVYVHTHPNMCHSSLPRLTRFEDHQMKGPHLPIIVDPHMSCHSTCMMQMAGKRTCSEHGSMRPIT